MSHPLFEKLKQAMDAEHATPWQAGEKTKEQIETALDVAPKQLSDNFIANARTWVVRELQDAENEKVRASLMASLPKTLTDKFPAVQSRFDGRHSKIIIYLDGISVGAEDD